MSIAAIPAFLKNHNHALASPALRFGLLLPLDWKRDSSGTENDNSEAWKLACPLNPTDLALNAALGARQAALRDDLLQREVLASFDAVSTAPFATGLGNEHPLENGFAFLHPYGLPYLPGSGVKGVLRQAARELADGLWGDSHGWTAEAITTLFGAEDAEDARRGALIFHDVIPQIRSNRLMVEIMTPHQGDYYQGKVAPHDSGMPKPIMFLSVPPGTAFPFLVGCHPALLDSEGLDLSKQWQSLLEAAFEHAFEWLGFGAKTSVGYGAMARDRKAETARREIEQARQAEAERQRQLEAIQAELPEDAGWIEARRLSGDWQDNARFLDDSESFLADRATLSAEAWNRLASELEQRYSGIMDDPDAVQGKKKKPKFKDRPRNLATRLRALKAGPADD